MLKEVKRIINEWGKETIEIQDIEHNIKLGAWETFTMLVCIDYLRKKKEIKLIKRGLSGRGDVLKIL